MFEVVIWASDGSEHADRALDCARSIAEKYSSRVVAVHVKEFSVAVRSTTYPVDVDEDEIERKVAGQAKELTDAGIDTTFELATTTAGNAAHAINDVAEAEGAGLIVVGTRGQAPLSGLMLGSVTQRLLHVAHRPVLAVPPA